jgi:hypothetical protein
MPGTIREALQTPAQKKLSYVETQITEMEAISIRNEVDIYINKNAEWEDHEKETVDTKIKELEKQNKTLAKALKALNKLQSELTK